MFTGKLTLPQINLSRLASIFHERTPKNPSVELSVC